MNILQNQFASTSEWKKYLYSAYKCIYMYICTMEYYFVLKKKTTLHLETWMNMEDIMFSEMS